MFDTYYSGDRHISVTRKEFRAPTDESVKLLREMESKAHSEVMRTIRVNDNILNGVIVEKYPNYFNQSIDYLFVFELNGKRFEITETVNNLRKMEEAELARMLYETVAKTITEQLIVENARKIL